MTDAPDPTAAPATGSDGSSSAPPPPGQDTSGKAAKPARGPTATKLDQRQRGEFLAAVASGKGIDQSLRSLDVSYRAYRNTTRDEPEFRVEVASARRAADDQLDEIGRLLALAGNVEVLAKLWERRDRARELNRARADRARERAEDEEERRLDRALRLHLAELAAATARARTTAESPEADDAPLDLGRLTADELETFRSLLAKVTGDPPDHPDTIAVGTRPAAELDQRSNLTKGAGPINLTSRELDQRRGVEKPVQRET